MKKARKKCYGMGIKQFLFSYYDITNERLLDMFQNLTHKQLKAIAPCYGVVLNGTSLKNISKEDLITGRYVLVADCHGDAVPYQNPNRKRINLDAFCENADNDLCITMVPCFSYEDEGDVCELDFSDDLYDYEVTEEYSYDDEGRQKTFKRVINIKRRDE